MRFAPDSLYITGSVRFIGRIRIPEIPEAKFGTAKSKPGGAARFPIDRAFSFAYHRAVFDERESPSGPKSPKESHNP